MNNILLVVASGKSSRFGGQPKLFAKIGRTSNIENTIIQSKDVINKVYVALNKETYEEYKSKVENCEMFPIKTGQGDAHSLLKCLKCIKSKEQISDRIMVCWGDAVFVSPKPFDELAKARGKVNVACSLDKQPYAWFDVDDNNNIVKAYFAKDYGVVPLGMHDQSLFSFDLDFAIRYLDDYRKSLGIKDDNDGQTNDINEMKLLYSFEYLKNFDESAKCFEITSGQVLSFNTKDELEQIRRLIDLEHAE